MSPRKKIYKKKMVFSTGDHAPIKKIYEPVIGA